MNLKQAWQGNRKSKLAYPARFVGALRAPVNSKRRSRSGQGMVEVLVGMLVLIPIALACVDLAVVAIGGEICTDLSKQAARAAANAPGMSGATAAVNAIQTNYHVPSILSSVLLTMKRYDNSSTGYVTVAVSSGVVLPVSIPLLGVGPTVSLTIQSTQPIVGISN